MATCAQLARRELLIADIEQEKSLNAVDLAFVAAIQFILDHIEQLPMQSLDEVERLQIEFCFNACAFVRRGPAVSQMLSSSSHRFFAGPTCCYGSKTKSYLLKHSKTRYGVRNHWRESSRATMTRMISLVPSRI